MVIHLPLEIYTCIFKHLLADERDGRQQAFKLRLVSKSIRAIIDHLLDRLLGSPSDRAVEILCQKMIAQPGLGARVEQIRLEEDEGAEKSEEEIEDEEGDEDEDDLDSDSDLKAEIRRKAERDREVIIAAAEAIKRAFESNPTSRYSQALEKNDLNWLTRSTLKTQKWILLFQLSNLKSLALTARTDKFTNMALFLRLPYLEELDFAVLAPGQDSEAYRAINYVPPVEILGTIISSTSRLRSLKFEDMSGTGFSPVLHDAPKLKRILEQHAAATLTYLSICLTNNDEKDWRMEQEFSHIKGYFGSMKSFTRLQGLVMQLEVLLGRPSDELRLKDVLPTQLRYFTGLNLPDYHGAEDSARLWNTENYLLQFQDLAEAATDGQHLPWLKSVKMHLNRKDYFSVYDDWPKKGQFDAHFLYDPDPRINFGLLAESRIYFGWVSGPYADDGPGPD
ncbi:hypothetical protein BDW60DRAFT_221411 [Aspergillus nidulans var. acristatus]|jgi:hypothetical protein